MENITYICDLCEKEIPNFDTKATRAYQNGGDLCHIQELLYSEYKVKHSCSLCTTTLAAAIDARIRELRQVKSEK